MAVSKTTKSAKTTSTSTLVDGPATVLGIWLLPGALAGSIVLRDGGASGEVKLDIDTPASAGAAQYASLSNIEFEKDVHATLTNVQSITIVYKD